MPDHLFYIRMDMYAQQHHKYIHTYMDSLGIGVPYHDMNKWMQANSGFHNRYEMAPKMVYPKMDAFVLLHSIMDP